jgi:hypothetical protein
MMKVVECMEDVFIFHKMVAAKLATQLKLKAFGAKLNFT